jgi:hypothetical protein
MGEESKPHEAVREAYIGQKEEWRLPARREFHQFAAKMGKVVGAATIGKLMPAPQSLD